MRRFSILNFKNFINADGIETGIVIIHRIFQLAINGFRNVKDKLGKLLVAGEADGNAGIQLVKETDSGSDHVLVILGAIQNPVHEKTLVLILAGQNLKGHGQHGAVGVCLGSLDFHALHTGFILTSGNGGEIPAAVLLGFLHIGLKALQINSTINLIKVDSHNKLPPKCILDMLQDIEQAGKCLSGFLCPFHVGLFLVSRGKPFNRIE